MNVENPLSVFLGRKYSRALGRRKSSVAVAKIYPKGQGIFLINGVSAAKYFGYGEYIAMVSAPLLLGAGKKELDVKIDVVGGGCRSQAEAIRLALARGLSGGDDPLKSALRQAGFLTVDARVKERKKPGLKRARRAPQWSKR